MAPLIMDDFCLSNVKFIERIHKSRYSQIFHVEALGRGCILKVYHSHAEQGDFSIKSKIFGWESTAYRRLKETGICDKGIVPDFYGIVTGIDAQKWPELKGFINDPLPPNALFVEYIPELQRISLGNYTEARLNRLTEMLAEIHAVRVLHHDVDPRNMTISFSEGRERVFWIDFDRALTYPLDRPLTQEESEEFRREMVLMKDLSIRPSPEEEDRYMVWTSLMTTD